MRTIMHGTEIRHALTTVAAFAVLIPTIAFAAPAAKLWDRWLANDPDSTSIIDHSAWNDFLRVHVSSQPDGINRLDYGAISPRWRAVLADYLSRMQSASIGTFDRAQQFAYWINLYNALTVQVVLQHYPVESIRDIDLGGGFFADGPWRRKLVTVEGESLSLDDIEHRILRPIWQDPRVHYAVNCAALGCPNLQPVAFAADNTETLLDTAARAFINDPRGVGIEGGRLLVSSIYQWFEEDFGGDDAGVIAHLNEFAEPPLARQLGKFRRIDGHRYDWRLNDAARSEFPN